MYLLIEMTLRSGIVAILKLIQNYYLRKLLRCSLFHHQCKMSRNYTRSFNYTPQTQFILLDCQGTVTPIETIQHTLHRNFAHVYEFKIIVPKAHKKKYVRSKLWVLFSFVFSSAKQVTKYLLYLEKKITSQAIVYDYSRGKVFIIRILIQIPIVVLKFVFS